MAFFIGRDREARRAYGFDEIALVPGNVTVNPEEVDTTLRIGPVKLGIPFLASAMDGVVDAQFAIAMGKMGGLGVLNLDGINTRYEKPREVVAQIASADPETATKLVQELYQEAGCDLFIVQSTVTTVKHKATNYKPFDITKFCHKMKMPIVVGNCVTYDV